METYATGEYKQGTAGVYRPTAEQNKQQALDRKMINDALAYRSRFEARWLAGSSKWNLIAPKGLKGTPNYVVPITRMATHTGVVSMRQALPEVHPVPEGKDEKKLGYILSEASAHVHRMSNMEAVMDMAMVDYAVLGNAVLESFVSVPMKCQRVPILDVSGEKTGEFKKVYRRDWSRPKIGTRARSIWECAFDPGARTIHDIKWCTFQDRLSFAEFEAQYKEKPDHDYINLDVVEAKAVWTFGNDGQLVREEARHDKVIIDHVQSEYDDSYRLYVNGILIWDTSLSGVHCHGKITLSLFPNHHFYDDNLKTHALYGVGEPTLLADLDDLINATTNMFILNYRNKNTYVVGIEGAGDVSEIDFTSGDPVNGKVTVQSLGAADLNEWDAFKTQIEQWGVQLVKKNWMRLEGEVAKTKYEAQQKKAAEDVGIEYQAKKMEAGGLMEYARKHVSDIMEHLTVEEWENILDEDQEAVKAIIEAGQIPADDYVTEPGGKILKVRYVEQIRTRGRVFKETLKSGKRSIDGLTELKKKRGQDGWLAASKEYVTTSKWRLFKKVPDIYLVGKTILGNDTLTKQAQNEELVNRFAVIGQLKMPVLPDGKSILDLLGIDADKLVDREMDTLDIRREELSSSADDERQKQSREGIEKAKAMKSQLLNPRINAQAIPSPVQGGAPVPGSGAAQQAAPPAPTFA